MSNANLRQVAGEHYRKHGGDGSNEQHWDRIVRLYPDGYHVYFIAAITKYCERYRDKNGIQDLEKAAHYLEKLIEVEKAKLVEPVKCPKCNEQDLQPVLRVTGSALQCMKCGFREAN